MQNFSRSLIKFREYSPNKVIFAIFCSKTATFFELPLAFASVLQFIRESYQENKYYRENFMSSKYFHCNGPFVSHVADKFGFFLRNVLKKVRFASKFA
jgi:hypothetical protein